jgi:hypothetical protein
MMRFGARGLFGSLDDALPFVDELDPDELFLVEWLPDHNVSGRHALPPRFLLERFSDDFLSSRTFRIGSVG